MAQRSPSNTLWTHNTGENFRVVIPRSHRNRTIPPVQNDNPPRQETLAQSSQPGIPLWPKNNEFWVEKASQSSCSSVSNEMKTGFYRQPSTTQTLPQQQQTTSSQEEYEKSGSEKDDVMASSNEHTVSTAGLVVQPSAGPKFKNTTEHRYFTIFQESMAARLPGYQTCYEEQWAMDIVIAIGALHLDAQSDRNHTMIDSESHYIFALQRYDKAICQVKQRQSYQLESSIRLALTFSLLATCFETYIGNNENAITQAKTGVDILLKWAAERRKESIDETDEWSNVRRVTSRSFFLDEDLLDAFQRLDSQVLLCRGRQPDRKAPQAYPTTDSPFKSVDKAYKFCDLVVRRVLHFHEAKNIKEKHSPPYLKHELYGFRVAMDQFFHSFEPILQSSRQEPRSKDSLRANLVMIRAIACCFAISQGLPDSEMYTNAYLRDYKLLDDLARELIDDQRKANFNFDMTLAASTFSVSYYCRDPTVRRAAAELLRQCPERKGCFDTLVELYCSQLVWRDRNTVRVMLPPVTKL